MRLEPVLHPLAHDAGVEPDAEVAAAERRKLRRLDLMAGVVGLAASAGFLANALLLQPPAPGPLALDGGPAVQARDKSRAGHTVTVPLPPAHSATASAPQGGATSGSLGYLSVRTTTAEAQVPLVPATPGLTVARAEPRSEPPPRRPPAGLAPSPDVTGTLRPPGEVPGTSSRILSVQKALLKLGYGPLKADGMPGGETRNAVLRFQRDRGLPADGEISDRIVRELAATSGLAVR